MEVLTKQVEERVMAVLRPPEEKLDANGPKDTPKLPEPVSHLSLLQVKGGAIEKMDDEGAWHTLDIKEAMAIIQLHVAKMCQERMQEASQYCVGHEHLHIDGVDTDARKPKLELVQSGPADTKMPYHGRVVDKGIAAFLPKPTTMPMFISKVVADGEAEDAATTLELFFDGAKFMDYQSPDFCVAWLAAVMPGKKMRRLRLP